MKTLHRTRALALALASAIVPVLALGAVTPAHADTHAHRDAARDVVSGTADESGDDISRPEPERREGDVRWLRVNHTPRVVRVTVGLDQLTRGSGGLSAFHVVSVLPDRGRRVDIEITVSGTDYQGQTRFSSGKRSRCGGLRTRIDYVNDTVQVSVPRSCVGNPRSVRVGAGSGSFDLRPEGRLYADDAQLDGRVENNLAFGPPVRRG